MERRTFIANILGGAALALPATATLVEATEADVKRYGTTVDLMSINFDNEVLCVNTVFISSPKWLIDNCWNSRMVSGKHVIDRLRILVDQIESESRHFRNEYRCCLSSKYDKETGHVMVKVGF